MAYYQATLKPVPRQKLENEPHEYKNKPGALRLSLLNIYSIEFFQKQNNVMMYCFAVCNIVLGLSQIQAAQ
jgi:hypothetical protein